MKSHAQVVAMSRHHTRSKQTLNASGASPSVLHLSSGKDPAEAVRSMMPEKVRKNAVVAVEMLLTASPEYFRPDAASAGVYSKSRLDAFKVSCLKWLRNRFGEQLASVTLHTDEVTPHIHVALVPLISGRLNARGLFGGREKLRELQDSFADALRGLGLERGIRGSSAKHQRVQQFYGRINRVERPALGLPPSAPALPSGPEGVWHVLTGKAKADRENYDARRRLYAEELKESFGVLAAKASAFDRSRRDGEVRKSEVVARRHEVAGLKAELADYKMRIEALHGEREELAAQLHQLQQLQREVCEWELETGMTLSKRRHQSATALKGKAFKNGG